MPTTIKYYNQQYGKSSRHQEQQQQHQYQQNDNKRNGPQHVQYATDFLRDSNNMHNNIISDIKSILYILKFTGMLPVFKDELTDNEIKLPEKPQRFYSFTIRLISHGLTIFYLYNLFTSGAQQLFQTYIGDTDNVNLWIEILLCILTYAITILLCSKLAKPVINILNDILRVDAEVKQHFGSKIQNNCGFVLKFVIGIWLCQFYLAILKVFQVPEQLTITSYILIGIYGLESGLSSLFIVFIATLLRLVTQRFIYCNLILTGYTYSKQCKAQRLRFTSRIVGEATIMEAFPDDSLFAYRMHNKLLRIYRAINESCSLILVAYMGYSFYSITTTTYNLFVQITSKNFISLNVLQWCLAWLCLHTSLLTLLSRTCGQATEQANTTAQILAKIYGKSKEYQNIIDKFLTKSIKQEVEFTAYGFFVIDNTTLFKIFSAVTTYLVILIQFKQLEDSKLEDQMNVSN